MKASELQSGDLIRLSEVARVTRVSHFDGTLNVFARFDDDLVEHRLANTRSMRIELLHRPKAKPAVGDLLTGAQVTQVPWKAGSVLKNAYGDFLMLTVDGVWVRDDNCRFSFERFAQSHRSYEVVLVVK